MIQRREFITLLGGAAATWPLTARAQQPAMPVIGFLTIGVRERVAEFLPAFRRGLSEAGFVEGQNFVTEYRWTDGRNDRLPALAAELVHRQVALIVTSGGDASAQAAKAATTTVPILFVTAVDPVEVGLVASLNRPGGNVTGVSRLGMELMPKRLQLLREVVPDAAEIGLLVNQTNVNAATFVKETEAAARLLDRGIKVFRANSDEEIEAAFADMVRRSAFFGRCL
jgi:putative ABC transport system substrate-binding protein